MKNNNDNLILELNRIIDKEIIKFFDGKGLSSEDGFFIVQKMYMNGLANLFLNNAKKGIPIDILGNELEDYLYEMVEDIYAGVINNYER